MLILVKYSCDAKDIEIFCVSDFTHLVSISSDNKFWAQKTTAQKYSVGDLSEDCYQKIENQPVFVFDSENVCHLRLLKHFHKSLLNQTS
ncbi:hypothetical protein GW764_03515 [Candidatus Parcubacteria bacterium]|nr:hypothetical protein [Candidatus Parcubacteria bacterium]